MNDDKEAIRQRIRSAAPDFFELIDRHYGHARDSIKLRALVVRSTGEEFGNVTPDLRERAQR